MQAIEQLPELAFLAGGVCNERHLIYHFRTASVVEIFAVDEVVLKKDVVSFRFANINAWGIKEHYVAALHYCATMPRIEDEADKEMLVEHILKPAAKFFCADNDDMDNEIINEELAKWN